MAIISMAVVLSITGCNQNADEDSAFQTLDIEQLETDTTDINDRAEYYDKNVDDRIDEMTDEEKEKFYVNLTLTYTGREYYEEDYIIFLRNDNVYEGDTIGLSPGIYRVISSKAEGGRGAALGDIYLLTPGEDVTLNVDYTSSKATIINDENTIHLNKYSFGISPQEIIRLSEKLGDNIEQIEFVGVVTNICVISNIVMFQSKYINSEIIVDASLCASFDKK